MPQPESFSRCACQHCGGHIEFPVAGAGRQIECPHCHWQTTLTLPQSKASENSSAANGGKRSLTSVGIAVAVVIAAAAVAFALFQKHSPQSAARQPDASNNIPAATPGSNVPIVAQTNAPAPKPKPPVDLWHGLMPGRVNLEKVGEGSLVYAVGTLTNDTKKQRFGIKVELEIVDEHKKKIGAATDYTDVIEPGKVWKYRALVTYKNAASARLTSVMEQK